MSAFAPALAPASTPEQSLRGKEAAGHLASFFHTLLETQRAARVDSLLTRLARQAALARQENTAAITANAIGLLFQAYDATAGLIGNTLVALATHPDLHARVTAEPHLLSQVIAEVLRYDPPVQNTRRFLARSGQVAGQNMQEGEAILVVLAAANRDPDLNPHPGRFELARQNRRLFTFGAGVHACPGATLAELIALAGLEQLLATEVSPANLVIPVTYRSSANTRIALLVKHDETILSTQRSQPQ